MHRRRSGTGSDHRSPRRPGGPSVTDAPDPEELDPDYDHHGGFPEYGPASPGPGFGRFVTAMRRVQDLAVSADPGDELWDDAADRAEALVELLGPVPGRRRRGAGRPHPGPARHGQPAAAALDADAIRARRCRNDGAFHPVSRRRQHGRCTAVCCRCCSTTCSGWCRTRRGARSAGRRSCTSTTARSPRSRRRWWCADGSPAPRAARRSCPPNWSTRDETLLAEANGLMVRLLPGQP